MQIVIKIDENLYTRLFDHGDIDAVDMLKACAAIRKGTPLPKGHGRLVDAAAIKYKFIAYGYDYGKDVLDDAPTIIDADGGDAE